MAGIVIIHLLFLFLINKRISTSSTYAWLAGSETTLLYDALVIPQGHVETIITLPFPRLSIRKTFSYYAIPPSS